jgi:hypothetical protein
MYIVIYAFYTNDEGHCSMAVRGMKNMYRIYWEMFQKMISWKAEKTV